MLKNYILVAVRNILRNKTISFINIFGLAVSMTVCLLLILIVADQYSYDNYHTDSDKIYRVITDREKQNDGTWSTATAPFPLAAALEGQQGVEELALVKKNFEGTAKWQQAEIPFHGLFANNEVFSIFNFPMEKGNAYEALTLPNAVVLSNEMATKLFGDSDPIGQTIEVEEVGEYVITGVLEEFPGKTHFDFDMLASVNGLPLLEKEGKLLAPLTDWHNIYDNYIYIKTSESFKEGDLASILTKASTDNYSTEGDYNFIFKMQPLSEITMGPLLSNTMGFGLPAVVIYVLLGLALVVMLSACFNYANLTTARAMNRAKEIGVRKVIGAGKKHIIAQFLIEAVIISLLAFSIAALLVEYLHPSLNTMFASLGAPIRFDKTNNLYLIYVGFAALTGIIAGIVPALFFSSTNALTALKKSINLENLGKKVGIARFSIRKVLVVTQFAFSIFFVVTIITIYQQMNMVLTADHGFKTENILNVKLEGMPYETIKNEFNSIANVQAIAATTHMPALGTNNSFEVDLANEEEPLFMNFLGVDNHYLNSMEIELLAGRNFPENMPNEERYILINERAVERIGWESPEAAIGQLLTTGDKQLEVIGVLKDFHYERMDEEIGPMALRYLPSEVQTMIVTINQDREKETLAQLEAAWKKHTNRPFNYSYFEDDLKVSYGYFAALLAILGYVTIIVVSLACLGLLGMVIFHIQNKTKEIGIRKTLGAEAWNITMTVSKSFIILIGISYLIAGPLAYFVNISWLKMNAYKIDFGVGTIAFGFLLVLAVVALTIGSQVYKALKINPVESLKNE